jgi:hypothetical protein
MRWVRTGLVFDPRRDGNQSASHAQVPTVLALDDRIRVFYADRNAAGTSFIAYVDVARDEPTRILAHHGEPLTGYGAPGTFDDEGMMPAFAQRVGNRVLMYYSGWNQGVTVPYRNSTGVLVSDDGGTTFRRLYEGPIMDRTPEEPYLAVTPTILVEGDRWRMWYISGLRWVEIAGKYEPVYAIKYAESADGITWTRPNRLCIPQRHPEEAFSHPSVIHDRGLYRMWYCYRDSRDFRDGQGAYRIGYAESADGLNWDRLDQRAGLDVGDDGWESTMVCYPFVFVLDGKVQMFYNGNGFGRTGFGHAVLSYDE